MGHMKKKNAYFKYKKQSLFKSNETKADELLHMTDNFQNQFNSVIKQMRRQDLMANKYYQKVTTYFNRLKQRNPMYASKNQNLKVQKLQLKQQQQQQKNQRLANKQKQQESSDTTTQDQNQKLQIQPEGECFITQQHEQDSSPKQGDHKSIKIGHRKMVRKQEVHKAIRKNKSSQSTLCHKLRKQKQIIQREKGQHQKKSKSKLKVLDAVVKTIASSPVQTVIPKYKMIRPNSASTISTDTISLISLAVHARQKRDSRLSIAQQAKLQEHKQKRQLREKFKQQFYYAMKNKKFQTDLFESARERITDIPGINVKDNINVHSLHNFQQYFESVNAKAENLVKICDYRTRQKQENFNTQLTKSRRMSSSQVDLAHQISLKHLKSASQAKFLHDQGNTGTLRSQIGNSIEFSKYVPPGYQKKNYTMTRKEGKKYSMVRGYSIQPKAQNSKYSSTQTTMIQSAKNQRNSTTRTHKKNISSLISGIAPSTSIFGDQKSDTLSSTRIFSKVPSRAMSFYNTCTCSPQQ